ncbi:MarR family transcriptional regulator [Alcaligenaceae bacterium CGII-47]|nr:MarR family transcriptional regulator [Alcaligenaceae bacterium CGII-47]
MAPISPEPLRFIDDYLPALLAHTSKCISSEFHEIARQNGLSVSEWRVMASLSGGGPLSVGQLAQVTLSKQSTVTRLLDRMQAKGQVERLRHEIDRRVILVRITPEGAKVVDHLIVLAREHELRVLEPLGRVRAEDLKSMLRQLIHQYMPMQPERGESQDAD